jgi:hypothetical protein
MEQNTEFTTPHRISFAKLTLVNVSQSQFWMPRKA